MADLRGKRPPHFKRWQIHPKRAGRNSLKSKQNKGIFIACLVVGFQAILRRKPITINIPLFPAGQASWLLFGRTARINSTKKLCFRHRASLRQSKTSPKRYTSDSAEQTSASVRGCTAPSGKRSDVQTEPSGAKLLTYSICFMSPFWDCDIICLR